MSFTILDIQKLSLTSSILVTGVMIIIICVFMGCRDELNRIEKDKREIPSIAECEKKVLAWIEKLPSESGHGEYTETVFSYKEWLNEGRNLPRAEEVLIKWLKERYDGVELGKVVYALGWIGGENSVPSLIDALTSNDISLRIEAVATLGRIGDPKAFKPVSALAHDSNYNVRANVCITVTKLDPKHAKELLIQFLNDEEDFVRKTAKMELQKLEKENDNEK